MIEFALMMILFPLWFIDDKLEKIAKELKRSNDLKGGGK